MRTATQAFVSALLLIVYLRFVTPVGLVLRLVRDPLHRELDSTARTYWIRS